MWLYFHCCQHICINLAFNLFGSPFAYSSPPSLSQCFFHRLQCIVHRGSDASRRYVYIRFADSKYARIRLFAIIQSLESFRKCSASTGKFRICEMPIARRSGPDRIRADCSCGHGFIRLRKNIAKTPPLASDSPRIHEYRRKPRFHCQISEIADEIRDSQQFLIKIESVVDRINLQYAGVDCILSIVSSASSHQRRRHYPLHCMHIDLLPAKYRVPSAEVHWKCLTKYTCLDIVYFRSGALEHEYSKPVYGRGR